MYLVFTCIPGESYCRRLKPLLLYVYYIVPILIFVVVVVVDSCRKD